MDERRLLEILHELGLSRRETEVYLFLVRKGPQKTYSVATGLKVDRVQTYRALTSLKQKGVVETTIESPVRYVAVPMEFLIESLIKTKTGEVTRLEAEKEDLVNYIKSISARESEVSAAKMQVLVGKKAIYAKITQMVNESRREVLGLTTSLGLIQDDIAGLLDTMIETARGKKEAEFRMLANISGENLDTMRRVCGKLPRKNTYIEWRHIELSPQSYPRFIIKDGEEAILFMSSGEQSSLLTKEDTGLWITSEIFVSTLRASFMELWRTAINANDRINELETGIPIEQTMVIKQQSDSEEKIQSTLDTAKNDVVLISSSVGINKILKNDPFRKYLEKGVKFRIMAPIDLDNLEAAQKLSKLYDVKHVLISYLAMMIVDSKHLFMFKAPPLGEDTEYPFYLPNTFYTNDQKYVERASGLLSDIWKRGTLVSEIDSAASGTQALEVSASSSVLEVINTMLRNSVTSVLVTKDHKVIGIIDQKGILERIVKSRKDPAKTTAHEIMTTPVLTVDSDQPLIDALKTMKQKRIPRLAVVKNGRLVAMLT